MERIKKSVSIISSSHEPEDERILFHFAVSLSLSGHIVSIISSLKKNEKKTGNIITDSFDGSAFSAREKASVFIQKLAKYEPDIIISQTPFTNFVAYKYRRKFKKTEIIYDVTEWHPSYSHLAHHKSLPGKIVRGSAEFLKNILSSFLVNRFIFGEKYKSLLFRILIPYKRYHIIPSYPSAEYFNAPSEKKDFNKWTLGYAGILNENKGIFTFLSAVEMIRLKYPGIQLKLLIVGWFGNQGDEVRFRESIQKLSQTEIQFMSKLSFQDFCSIISEIDIFYDLRIRNFENNYSLPIKIFYFMACGKPTVYSRLKSIEKELPEYSSFCHLVDPEDIEDIAETTGEYFSDQNLYLSHSANAIKLYRDKYNWQNISREINNITED